MCEAGHILLDPTIVPAEAAAFAGERIPLRPVRRVTITTLVVTEDGRNIRGVIHLHDLLKNGIV